MVGEQLVEVDSVADNGTATLVAPHDMELGTYGQKNSIYS